MIGRARPSTDADDELVVGELSLGPCGDDVLVRGDALESAANQLNAEFAKSRGQFTTLRRLVGERLLNRQRLVEEIRLRSEHGEPSSVIGKVRERQGGLKAGDASADDQDLGPGIFVGGHCRASSFERSVD